MQNEEESPSSVHRLPFFLCHPHCCCRSVYVVDRTAFAINQKFTAKPFRGRNYLVAQSDVELQTYFKQFRNTGEMWQRTESIGKIDFDVL